MGTGQRRGAVELTKRAEVSKALRTMPASQLSMSARYDDKTTAATVMIVLQKQELETGKPSCESCTESCTAFPGLSTGQSCDLRPPFLFLLLLMVQRGCRG